MVSPRRKCVMTWSVGMRGRDDDMDESFGGRSGSWTHLIGRGASGGAHGDLVGRNAALHGDGFAGESRGGEREGAHRVVFLDKCRTGGAVLMRDSRRRGVCFRRA